MNGNECEQRFLRWIVENHPTHGVNGVAFALFNAIQDAFNGTNSGKAVLVDPYLVHNLAACGWVALGYNVDQVIPWDKADHDAIIKRTLNGFMKTVAKAIRDESVTVSDGVTKLYGFHIPDWFVKEAKTWRSLE